MKKSVLCIGLFLVLCFSVWAGGSSQKGSPASAYSDSTKRFMAYAWGDAHIENYKKQQADFMSKFPGYDFIFDQDSNYENFLTPRAASDTLPDLFMAHAYVGLADYAAGGLLLDLTNEPWVSGLPTDVRNSVSYEGKVYGYPYSLCYTGFFYNIDLFNRLNLKPPATISEFRAVCEALKAAGVQPIAVGGGGGNSWVYIQFLNSLFGNASGARFEELVDKLNKGAVSLTDFPNYQGVKALYDMAVRTYNYTNPLDHDYSAMISDFATGKAGMYHNGSWSPFNVLEIAPDMNIGFFGYPVSENPNDIRITWDTEIVMVAAHNTKCISGVKAFYSYLADANAGAKNIAELQGRIPAISVEIPKKIVSQTYDDAMKYVNTGKANPWMDQRTPTGLNVQFGVDLQEYVRGTLDFDTLAGNLSRYWREAYAANN